MTDLAVELSGVKKKYRYFTLDDIHLKLPRGQIMGLIGANPVMAKGRHVGKFALGLFRAVREDTGKDGDSRNNTSCHCTQ
jgi:ABC-type uncharacterized transport system ATPase subunit